MMKKNLLLLCALLLTGVSAWGQTKTDVTSKITNPSFESNGAVVKKSNLTAACTDITGWTITTTNTGFNNEEVVDANTDNSSAFGKRVNPKDGSYYFFARQGWFNNSVNITMQTTTTELEAGEYELTADFMATENSTAQDKLKFSVTQASELNSAEYNFDRSTATDYFAKTSNWKEAKVTFIVTTKGTVTIEVKAILNGSNSPRADFILDNFKLYKVEGADVSVLEAKITAVQAVVDNSTGDKTAINTAITTATDIKNNPETQSQVDQAVIDLHTAYETYILAAAPNSGYTFDYTFKVGDIYNTGSWTSTTSAQNKVWKTSTEKNTGDCVATGFYENWKGSTYDGKIYHQFTELRAGIYNVTALAFANTGDGTANVYGNAATADLSGESAMFQRITAEGAVVTDGKLEVGLQVASKNWIGISTINLAYVRELTSSDFPAYTLATGKMNKDLAAAQTQAEQTYLTTPNLANYNALTAAITAANTSVAIYEQIAAISNEGLTNTGKNKFAELITAKYNDGTYNTLAEAQDDYKTSVKAQTEENANFTLLLNNPSFENDKSDWTFKTSMSGWIDVSINTKNPADGSKLLNAWAGQIEYCNVWQKVTLPAGQYTLSAKARTNAEPLENQTQVRTYINGVNVSSSAGLTYTADETAWDDVSKWIELSTIFSILEDTEVELGIYSTGKNTSGNQQGWYQVDDFQLVRNGAPTTMTILEANKWATFYAPFAVDVPANVYSYAITVDEGVAVRSKLGGDAAYTLPANTPVLVYTDNEGGYTKTFTADAATGTPVAAPASNYLVGTAIALSSIPATAGKTNYVLQNGAKGIAWYPTISSNTLPANRAYLSVPDGIDVKGIFDFTTGINEVREAALSEGMYNMAGQKVGTNYKGVVIKNGKKMLNK